jgi:hypothetical protein
MGVKIVCLPKPILEPGLPDRVACLVAHNPNKVNDNAVQRFVRDKSMSRHGASHPMPLLQAARNKGLTMVQVKHLLLFVSSIRILHPKNGINC